MTPTSPSSSQVPDAAPLHRPAHSHALVVGGGTMGADVAIVMARAGCRTTVCERSAERRVALRAHVREQLQALDAACRSDLIETCGSLDEVHWPAISLVIECIPEKLDLKRELFAELERQASASTLLCSNSSSFPISSIAEGRATPGRMIGLHFFMPAHLTPLVEVVLGQHTEAALADALAGFMRRCGMVPVIVRKDLPGFLANRLQHALSREAFALIDAGVATPEDVDAAVRFGFGFRFLAAGPVMQRDHAGIDVHCAAAATMYPTFSNTAEPSQALRDCVAEGRLGMKTGEGFYRWTPETAAAERRRYDEVLRAGLRVLAPELPPIDDAHAADPHASDRPAAATDRPAGGA